MDDKTKMEYIEYMLLRPGTADVNDNTPITPLSSYGDDKWVFPSTWLPANKRTMSISHDVGLTEHYTMLRKQILLCSLKLVGGGWGYKKQPKPSTLKADASVLRRIFAWFQGEGYEALSDVSFNDYQKCISTLEGASNLYQKQLSFISRLYKAGKISDGFVFADTDITTEQSYMGLEPANENEGYGTWQPIPDDDLLSLIRTAGHVVQRAGDSIVQAYKAANKIDDKYYDGTEPSKDLAHYKREKARVSYRRKKFLDNFEWPELDMHTNVSWPPRNALELNEWVQILQISIYSIVALQIGARDSEMQSIEVNSWKKRRNNWILDTKIFKTSASFAGTTHTVPINEDAYDALQIQKKLYRVAHDYGLVHDKRIFFGLQGGALQTKTSLLLLAELSSVKSIHSHQFRKSLARLVALAIVDSPKILQELFGHADIEMTLNYIMALPGMDEELREAVLSSRRDRAGQIYDEAEDAGGGAGERLRDVVRELQADVATNLGHNRQDEINREARNRFIQTVLRGGLGLRQVSPGVICVKAPIQSGFCATKGEELNAGQCQMGCPQHLELSEAKERAYDVIWHLIGELQTIAVAENPLLRKHYRRQLAESVCAWPDIKAKLGNDPIVRAAIDEQVVDKGDAEW